MSYNINDLFVARNSRSGYQIEQSLRFDGSSGYLSRTPGSNTSTNKKGTFSAWMKVSANSGTNGGQFIGAADTYAYGQFYNQEFYFGNSSSYISTAAKIRDYSAWYHVVFVFDTTLATANDRMIIYVNGSRQATGTFNTQPSQNSNFVFINTAQVYNIGRRPSNQYFNGYLSEVNFIDGSALTPGDFGEEDDNGVWRPIKYAGSYTGNSFYLKFDAADVDGDSSGLGNDWTANNISTSGTGTDVMSDTPTTNWCTLNPLNTDNISTFSEGNLSTVCSTGAGQGCSSGGSIAVSSGKWYCEMVCTAKTATNALIGICTIDGFDGQRQIDESQNGGSGYGYVTNGTRVPGGTSYGTTWAVDDIMGIAMDLDSAQNTVTFYKNGVSQGAINITNARYVFGCSNGQGSSSVTYSVNFGQRDFSHTPPTGYSALNTAALPAPDIADGSQYFDTFTWTGDSSGASRTFSGLAFGPDLVWAKGRNQAISHQLTDIVRGAGATSLRTDDTRAEGADGTSSGYLSAFTSDGFETTSSSTNVYYNTSGYTYVAWCWDAGGSGSSNTDGSITSTVSANTTAGFSIVTYTGNGTSGATVGHGLGVAPDLILPKVRSRANDSWHSYHSALGGTKGILLNSANAEATDSGYWNNTNPTSTVFTVGTYNTFNNETYVAYCFAEVEGYSKFGSYTGNGNGTGTSVDGPFIYTGFTPKYFLYKTSSNTAQWQVVDSTRGGDSGTANPVSYYLVPNAADGEVPAASSNYGIDFCSNGIKIRTSNVYVNNSGWTYIYAAFAENPFGGDGVSPATAR